MNRIDLFQEDEDMRITPKSILMLVALGKAVVAGIGAGIALLGALDIAFAATAQEWWDGMKVEHWFNVAAVGGGVAGFFVQLVLIVMDSR